MNENVSIQVRHKDVGFEDESGTYIHRIETTVVYTADIMKAEQPTGTGRVYPHAVLERAIAEFQQRIQDKTALGVAHPTGEATLPLADVSHVITSAHLHDAGVVTVQAQTLQTPAGKELAKQLQAALNEPLLELQPTGFGSVIGGRVSTDYTIRSFDFVAGPPGTSGK